MPKVQVRLTEKERDRLRELAAERKLSMSDLIRQRLFEPRLIVDEVERTGRSDGPDVVARNRELDPQVGPSAEPRGFRCPLPACRHQQKRAGKCPRHGHELVPVRL